MKDIMGVESFVQAYNLVRQKVKATRDKRKKIEKITAIVNPMRHAQKKMKLTGKRQAQKKKKIFEKQDTERLISPSLIILFGIYSVFYYSSIALLFIRRRRHTALLGDS